MWTTRLLGPFPAILLFRLVICGPLFVNSIEPGIPETHLRGLESLNNRRSPTDVLEAASGGSGLMHLEQGSQSRDLATTGWVDANPPRLPGLGLNGPPPPDSSLFTPETPAPTNTTQNATLDPPTRRELKKSTDTYEGYIRVVSTNAVNGVHEEFGYLGATLTPLYGYHNVTQNMDDRLRVSLPVRWYQAQTSPFALAIVSPNPVYPYLGAVAGYFSTDASINPGSRNYLYLAETPPTAPGIKPRYWANSVYWATNGGAVATWLNSKKGKPLPAESSIWRRDCSGQITASWVNPDGKTIPAFIRYTPNDPEFDLFMTGDPAAFEAWVGRPTIGVSLFFESDPDSVTGGALALGQTCYADFNCHSGYCAKKALGNAQAGTCGCPSASAGTGHDDDGEGHAGDTPDCDKGNDDDNGKGKGKGKGHAR